MGKLIEQLEMENEIFGYGLTKAEITKIKALGEKLKKYEDSSFNVNAVYKGKKTKWAVSVGGRSYHSQGKVTVSKITRENYREFKGAFNVDDRFFFKFFPTKEEFEFFESIHNLSRNILDNYVSYSYREEQKAVTFSNMEELKAYYSKQIMHNLKKGKGMDSSDVDDFEDEGEHTLSPICKLFDKDLKEIKKNLSPKLEEYENKILVVVEKDNQRLYIYQRGRILKDYNNKRKYTLVFDLVTPDDREYNFVDENRIFITSSQHSGRNKIFLYDDLTKYDVDVIKEILRDTTDIALNNKDYERYAKRYLLKVRKNRREEQLKETYKKELENIRDYVSEKPFTYNDMNFNSEGVEYQGLKLSVLKIDDSAGRAKIANVEFIKHGLSFESSLDFNRVTERFVGELTRWGDKVETIIGKVKVTYLKKTIEIQRQDVYRGSIEQTHHYINDKKINQADVLQVLERGICFEEQDKYDALVAEVGKVSLKYHEALNHGLMFQIYNDDVGYRTPYVMRLRLERDKNAYQLVVGKEKLRLKQSGRLIDWSNLGQNKIVHMQELWGRVKDIIPDITNAQMVTLFKEGLKEQKRVEEKAQALLDRTIKNLKIKEETLEIQGRDEEGYVIKGQMRTYFLTKDLKVYDYNTKHYFCIVDRTHSLRVHKDKLVNRMYALTSDHLLVNEITTLNQH